MTLPFYHLAKEDKQKLNNLIGNISGNRGLIFNKFFNRWVIAKDGDTCTIKSDKTSWVQSVSNRPTGDSDLLAEAVERLIDLISFTSGKYLCYQTAWRFVTGMGLNHPIENGMAWHHTLGVPYLPGSSVKGLVRAWAEQWLERPPKEIGRVFGPRNTKKDGCDEQVRGVGSIIFFDALPARSVRLAADVMTPHYPNYYSKGETPGDWMDPNPIPFLTVSEGQTFLFALAPRRRGCTEDLEDLNAALLWLEEALENIGAGAKTAAGYGRFQRCTQTEEKLEVAHRQRKEEKAKQTSTIPAHLAGPLADEMVKDQYDTDPDSFLQILKSKWLDRMQAEETAKADQLIIANLLKSWYQVYRKGQWEKPNRKNAPAIKSIRIILDQLAP